MRVWSVHPKYLDAKGLVALWRETLLAQKVLRGETKGYRNHPQLVRFRETHDPITAIGTYLTYVHEEAVRRGYRFDESKIYQADLNLTLNVTKGQLGYEWRHLLSKLEVRSPDTLEQLKSVTENDIETHPMFTIIDGEVEHWERVEKT
ncbi:hypothetical protein ABID56_001996 [Alkalibacillus flavidus]|uniref:DNA lyase n=1 Tax=Alkalibacillus flavidus TaxID=546021 RepID=A0ABV2KYV0_9BACI